MNLSGLNAANAAKMRDQVDALLPTDVARALRLAREIEHPWYRCQALASVARHIADEQVPAVIEESLSAARQGEDAYQVVSVCAWPLNALVARGRTTQATSLLSSLMAEQERIEPQASRAWALKELIEAAFPLGAEARRPLVEALRSVARNLQSWAAARQVRDALLILASEDPGLAKEMAEEMREDKFKRQALRRLDRREYVAPRAF